MSDKTLFINLGTGTAVRNVLRTNIFSLLKKNKLRIVLITSMARDRSFQREFASPEVIIELLHPYQTTFIETIIYQLAVQLHHVINHVATHEIRKKTHPRHLSVKIISLLAKLLPRRLSFVYKLINFSHATHRVKYYSDLIERYGPDLVFSTNPYDLREIPIIYEAQQRKIKVIPLILSWDNLTSHPLLPTKFDHVIVWNNFMLNQLIELYGYQPNEVSVSGIPQMDLYTNPQISSTREKFISDLALDSNKKIITYSTAPFVISPHEPEIINELAQAFIDHKFLQPVQILIRLHPRDDIARYDGIKHLPIHFDMAGKQTPHLDDKWNPDLQDMHHLADTCKYSDVLVNVASTMNIDAAPFDTPIVNIGFDGPHQLPYLKSVRRYYYEYTHYIEMMKCGGSKLVFNTEEMVSAINDYLLHPEYDRDGRKRIVEKFCYRLDGHSAQRVVEALLSILKI